MKQENLLYPSDVYCEELDSFDHNQIGKLQIKAINSCQLR